VVVSDPTLPAETRSVPVYECNDVCRHRVDYPKFGAHFGVCAAYNSRLGAGSIGRLRHDTSNVERTFSLNPCLTVVDQIGTVRTVQIFPLTTMPPSPTLRD